MEQIRRKHAEKENDHQYGNKKRRMSTTHPLKQLRNYQSLNVPAESILAPSRPESLTIANTKDAVRLYGSEWKGSTNSMGRFLRGHKIDGYLRGRMLDWMVEVTASYKFTSKGYFAAVDLMDRYFALREASVHPAQLHVTGVVAMQLASKMHEVYPLRIKTVYSKIAHQKIPVSELVDTEASIMETLGYKLDSWTFYDVAMLKLCNAMTGGRKALGELRFSTGAEEGSEKEWEMAEQLCSYICKFILYDYDFISSRSPALLGQAAARLTLSIMDRKPCESAFSEFELTECVSEVTGLVRGHSQRFSGLSNLFKFAEKAVVERVQLFIECK